MLLFETEMKNLHIVSFDVPYPPNYGGVIDVYYKIRALAAEGVRVHLHSFQYGRTHSEKLEKLCHKVYYYKREVFKDPFFGKQPYIVSTRNSPDLLTNLLKDNHPILFEGIHCCYFLDHPALRERTRIVRMHNLEHVYYKNLARVEKNLVKKYFFSLESDRLRKFNSILSHATAIAAISPFDFKQLSLKFDNVFYLPAFHPNSQVHFPETSFGKFALYHGNLGVGENNEAALYLVKEVFKDINYPLIIAGMNPSRELKKLVSETKNIKLYDKPDTESINTLINQAHINVLPTFQSTGIKLKLINVLYNGRHCVVNQKMVANTGLDNLCHICNTTDQMQQAITALANKGFDQEEMEIRKSYLEQHFDNEQTAQILIEHAFSTKLV